jgi:hypothetical protein
MTSEGKASSEIYARLYWNSTGVMLRPGYSYQFSATGSWWDAVKKCGADGYPKGNFVQELARNLRRSPENDWFALVGAVNRDLSTRFLNDATERADNCATIYRHSLLYLVSNAFEHQRGVPLLGMEIFLNQVSPSLGEVPGCTLISCPTGTAASVTDRSTCTSHGGFSGDSATREAILARIAARHKKA